MQSENKYYSIVPCSPKEAWLSRGTVFFLLIFCLINIYLTPYKHIFEMFNVQSVNGCPLLTFTGVPCPMCGMGRSFSCLTDLNFKGAFYYNPSAPVFYLVSIVGMIALMFINVKNQKIRLKEPAYRLWWVLITLTLIMWVLNILFGHHH